MPSESLGPRRWLFEAHAEREESQVNTDRRSERRVNTMVDRTSTKSMDSGTFPAFAFKECEFSNMRHGE